MRIVCQQTILMKYHALFVIFDKMEDVCYVFGQLSSVMRLRNLCYSKISVVMLPGYRIAGISRKLESERKKYALRPYAAYLNSLCHTYLVQNI